MQVLQDQFGSSIHTALIIKPDNFWQKQRTNLGSQKYKFEVNILNLFNTYRVDRMLCFFSSPPHRDSAHPLTRRRLCTPLLWFRRGGGGKQ